MAKESVKNIAAFVRARLLNVAKMSSRDFDAVLLPYIQERFLYRLSISPYRQQLILKGALMFLAYEMTLLRTTRDIDFLGSATSNDLDEIRRIISAIVRIDCADGVEFDDNSVSIERITEDADYHGVRVKLDARLTAARKVLQLDIGFGDVLVAGPVEMNFPVLLDDQQRPHLVIYSRESAIAEKFEALVSLNLLTSRMKDIYDILHLAERESFSLATLRQAIMVTFARRVTVLEDRRLVFSQEFTASRDKAAQWNAFLRGSRVESKLDIAEAIARLERFLEPVCAAEDDDNATWSPEEWRWTKVDL
ncbi:MAG: nucleotidyl transferase AbiEii/AbiGii toxin family protein [Geobacteraceae bacterium]|nr:nucleotidyl transferase AbiEii/AbiGii toxin family protein [Geobacteraceae bacterium]